MAEDLANKIQALMSNPEAMSMISSLMGSGSKSEQTDDNDAGDSDFLANIQNAMSSFNNGNDKRINLLRALKPYMREKRASNIDKAIKMLRLSQISSLLRDI